MIRVVGVMLNVGLCIFILCGVSSFLLVMISFLGVCFLMGMCLFVGSCRLMVEFGVMM